MNRPIGSGAWQAARKADSARFEIYLTIFNYIDMDACIHIYCVDIHIHIYK